MNTVVVIGGGAAGLMAAYELSKHKNQVIILEAKNSLGGRIKTIKNNSFSQPIEAGAEFVHGDLPITLSLLNEAGIRYHAITDKMFNVENGKFQQQNDFADGWSLLMKQMEELRQDMTLAEFLSTFFGEDKYEGLRKSVKGFAGGFDLADANDASVKSLYREWSEEMDHQYRIDDGYIKLIDYLETKCRENGCIIHTNCCVKKIDWQQNEVYMITMCSRFFTSSKIIITVPLSVLQANADHENYLEFSPAIPAHIQAIKNIGFGSVIKIVLEFNYAFWMDSVTDAGFILTKEEVSTWWTQLPLESPVLTGWIGGEKAVKLKESTAGEILEIALQSLANAFAVSIENLKSKLKASSVYNWFKVPDINGGYSYNTIESADAKRILHQPINNTIFFAGEALFEGTPVGTVEAALSSGKEVALQIIKTQ